MSTLEQAGEFVENKRAGHGDVQAQTGADHGNLDTSVQKIDRLRRDARLFVAEDRNRAGTRRRQIGEPDCLIGQLDTENMTSSRTLTRQPPQWVADTMHARRPA